jgi:hypothetical protein
MGNVRLFTGKRPFTKFSCSFTVKAVPVFTMLLAIDFAIESF